ncbi:TIGR04197 family type VII secretion effector [Lentibacillus sp. L22]|uniref:TIGR04197 family type VII secretion effector n=1 Tax=Lentibacillus TaxID=175304 RepID=UPI0022B09C52|nr:TIGR04197 family type VII secretion effector [Lentibacillus daqui]
MGEEVGIQLGEFRSKVEKLRSSVTSIESGIKTGRTFEKTNIKPFKNDLKNTIEAIELLQKYKTLLHSDIDTLENVGEKIEENDEKLAELSTANVTGAQPMV